MAGEDDFSKDELIRKHAFDMAVSFITGRDGGQSKIEEVVHAAKAFEDHLRQSWATGGTVGKRPNLLVGEKPFELILPRGRHEAFRPNAIVDRCQAQAAEREQLADPGTIALQGAEALAHGLMQLGIVDVVEVAPVVGWRQFRAAEAEDYVKRPWSIQPRKRVDGGAT